MKRIYLLTSIFALACSGSDDVVGTDGTSTTETSSTTGATDTASPGSTSGGGGSSSGGSTSGSGSTGDAGGLYSPCDFVDDPICGDGTCLIPGVGIKGVCTQACNGEDDVCPEHSEGAPVACRLNQHLENGGDWWCLPDCVEGMACPEGWMCADFFESEVSITNVCWP